MPLEEANVSISSHSFMYGSAVFEGIRGYWNEQKEQMFLFRVREHFERMRDSMRVMHLTDIKYSVEELGKIVVELVKHNQPRTDVYIRPCAYKHVHRIGTSLENLPSELCIFTVPFGSYFHGAAGLRVHISSWRRIEDNAIPPRAKISGAYANACLAKTDAVLAGFDECIVLSENGHVAEGSAMNVFIVKKGILITTPGTENILEGITRNSLIELAEKELGLKTVIRQIDRSELYTADEMFFSGTGAQVTPILEVDKRPVGDGKAGSISNRLMDLYYSVCRGEVEKYHHWLTAVYPDKGTKTIAPVEKSKTGIMTK